MPEFLQPGIYVEQTDPDSRPAAPIATSLDDAALEALAADVRLALRTHAPDWTDFNDSDPGSTLVEAMAFLAENLLFRGELPERARLAAARAASALSAVARDRSDPAEGLERPVFFSGRLLDAATLTAEQDYHREKLRRHNRALIGYGTVSGLDVRMDDATGSGGAHLAIEPGLAIDRRGEELFLPCAVSVRLRATSGVRFVTLGFHETPHPASAARSIQEGCVIGIHPDAAAPSVPLARLIHSNGRWQTDPDYERPRTRPAPHP